MNIVILFIGLFLAIISFVALLLDKKGKKNNINDYNQTYADSKVNTNFIENQNGFKEILDNINLYDKNKNYTFDSEKKLSDSLELILNNINISTEDNNSREYEEKIKYESQSNISEKVIELSKSGLRAEEIAKILGKGVREIEIILKFQNKKN